MAYEPGGISGKLGGDYEALRAALALLDVALNRAASFRAEMPGPPGEGVEFEVVGSDGTIVREQCKGRNGMRPEWSIVDLRSRSVLNHMAAQLADECLRFRFTSGVPAVALRTLAERAYRCESSVEFLEHKLTNAELRAALPEVMSAWDLDEDHPDDLDRAWRMLRRVEVRWDDEAGLRERAHERAAAAFRGEAAACIACLKDLFVTTLGRRLGPHDVVDAMKRAGHGSRLEATAVVAAVVAGLEDRYVASLRPLMIGGATLGRSEAATVRSLLDDPAGPRVIVVAGRGGVGKSGVMLEVADGLAAAGVPHLPVRLDRDGVPDSAQRSGEQLGLSQAPHAAVHRVAGGGAAVLMIDQLDAMRDSSRHSPHAWHTCRSVLGGILAGDTPGVRAIVACRSLDLRADPEVATWIEEHRRNKRLEVVEVKALEPTTVRSVLQAHGLKMPPRRELQELLRLPFLLSLYLELDHADEAGLDTQTQLLDRYWERQFRKIVDRDAQLRPAELIDAVAVEMDRRAALSVPRREHAARFGRELEAMLSADALIADGDRLAFAHQIHADHHMARLALRQVSGGGGSIVGWLDERRQSPFRRRPLRRLLDLLRDDNPRAYARAMRELFDDARSPRVRFHLRHLTLAWLGQLAAPTQAELDLVLTLAERPDLRPHVEARVLAHPAWLRRLHERGRSSRGSPATAAGCGGASSASFRRTRTCLTRCCGR